MGFDLYKTLGVIDTAKEVIDLTLATVTNLGCIAVVVIASIWWWSLRKSENDFRDWFLGTAILLIGVWAWSISGISLILDGTGLPDRSLLARALIAIGVLVKVVVATRRRRRSVPGPLPGIIPVPPPTPKA